MSHPVRERPATGGGEPPSPLAAQAKPRAAEAASRASERAEMAERVRALRLDDSEVPAPPGRGRRWFWAIAMVLASAAVLFGFREHVSRWASELFSRVREVDSITVTFESSVEVVLDTTGYVMAGTMGKVSAGIPGTIIELTADEGDKVTAGQVLGRLDDTQYRADLEQAEAGLALAQARLDEALEGARQEDVEQARAALAQAEAARELASKQLDRARQLGDTLAPAEFDRIEAGHEEAVARVEQLTQALRATEAGPRREQIDALEAEVERAEALVEKARYFVRCTGLVAPIAGTITERSATLGESVLPEAIMNSLFVIADLGELDAEIDVQEQDLAEVRLEQPCVVTIEAYPDREYAGRLNWFSPVFNRQRGVCRAKVRILDPDEKLMPDMNCRVRVLREESPDGLRQIARLPAEAVVRRPDGAFVYVLDVKVARRRSVELGPAADGKVEVSDGLRSGELVLLPGREPLADGEPVHLRRPDGD